jgi:hypothetical protein
VPEYSDAQIIELFHLSFLRVLGSRLDPSHYVLKGGANLRYFMASVRYSEDIDLDMEGIEPWKLADKVDDVLGSPAMGIVLRAGGLSVDAVTKPKQTDTTRRWKVGIAAPGRSEALRTKIEFSRRNGEDRYATEPVPGEIVAPYALAAPVIRHYLPPAATDQKILALAGRSETQARDVFDLELLLRGVSSEDIKTDAAGRRAAADRGLELPFEAFRDQVLPFLDPDVADLYGTREFWERAQLTVAQRLTEGP